VGIRIDADTSNPVVRLPVSTVNTVATHAYSFKPILYFRTHTPHTYITCTCLYPAQNHFQYKKFVQPDIGIGIAVADSIRYRVPARYQSNPVTREYMHLLTYGKRHRYDAWNFLSSYVHATPRQHNLLAVCAVVVML